MESNGEMAAVNTIDGKDVFASDIDSDDGTYIAREQLKTNRKKKKSGGFQMMGLQSNTLKAITHMGYKVPTPIQRKVIPIILEGRDVVGMARTGSGKTAAFLIPLIEKLKTHSIRVGVRAVILSPSRELAMQTSKFCKDLCKYTDLRVVSLVGGDNLNDHFSAMISNPDVLVATPGRLLHLLVEMKLDLRLVNYVVFDEADRLFEMGFAVQLYEIIHCMPPPESRQTVLFSATLPKVLVDFAKAGLKADPVLVRLDVDTKISKELEMAFFTMKPGEKDAALLYLLREIIKTPIFSLADKQISDKGHKKTKKIGAHGQTNQTIIFVSTKHHVEYLNTLLKAQGYAVSYIYGTLDQSVRSYNLTQFRDGKTQLLIVTDVAARGIDIPILENVVNWDFAPQCKVFLHRVGRVARAGRRGWAWSFLTSDEMPFLLDLQLFLGREFVYATTPEHTEREYDYTRSMVVGCMPYHLMESDLEWVRLRQAEDVNLALQSQVAANGYRLYAKSRPVASAESYKRYKTLLQASPFGQGVHPYLASYLSVKDTKRVDLLKQLTHFRPSETIFEVGKRGGKSIEAQIMKKRRLSLGGTIAKSREQTERASDNLELSMNASHPNTVAVLEDIEIADEATIRKNFIVVGKKKPKRKRLDDSTDMSSKRLKADTPKSFVDPEYYLTYTPADFNTEKGYSMNTTATLAEGAQVAMLDLTADDNKVLRKGRGKLVWNDRKKDFKRETLGSDNKKLITGESGVKLPASLKSDRFEQWKKQTKIKLPRVGESELPQASQLAKDYGEKRWRHNTKVSNDSTEYSGTMHMSSSRGKRDQHSSKGRHDDKGKHHGKNRFDAKGKQDHKGKKGNKTGGNNHPGSGGKPRSELKSVSQIAKGRKIAEQRKLKNARTSKKPKRR